MNEFKNFRPGSWSEDGVTIIILRIETQTVRKIRPRRSEGWPVIALSAVLAFSTVLGSTVTATDSRLPLGAAAKKVYLGEIGERQYMTPTGRFDVSPEYWTGLIAKIREWRALGPDDSTPYSEPFI